MDQVAGVMTSGMASPTLVLVHRKSPLRLSFQGSAETSVVGMPKPLLPRTKPVHLPSLLVAAPAIPHRDAAALPSRLVARSPNRDFEPRTYSSSPVYEAQSGSTGLKVGESSPLCAGLEERAVRVASLVDGGRVRPSTQDRRQHGDCDDQQD